MKKSIVALLSVMLLAYLLGKVIMNQDLSDEIARTESACRYGSEITKKGFIGTEFENFDFYQSCLENVYNTNPLSRENYAKQKSNQH